MNDPLYRKLRETAWRRELSPAEEAECRAWLLAHPELQADWEEELHLSEALARLPDAPVPTHFTARVLSRVDAAERQTGDLRRARPRWTWSWRRLLPQAAAAAVVIALGVLAYERHQVRQRAALAQNLAAVSNLAAVPSPEILQDFESIRRLDQKTGPDEELLALLK
jgi:anti-sigma factor RsiW